MNSAKTNSVARDPVELPCSQWKSSPLTTTCASICVIVVLAAFISATTPPALAQTETVLYSFPSNASDGYQPYAGLSLDTKGNLYGTTYFGGTNSLGTVYKVTPTGTETVLYSFAGGADGANPVFAGVVLDKAGNLYGTTTQGGANNVGTVFKLTPKGVETVLHSFANDGVDGYFPYAGVVLDQAGNLYGTTYQGGASNSGTVYKITPAGKETILHNFANNGTDGCNPYGAGVVLGKKNVLYGTTANCGANGFGIVFKLSQSGTETVLHSFANDGTDGNNPEAGVILDKTGNIYGTTFQGGANGFGTVFKLAPTGNETVLHAFGNNGTDGRYPQGAGVILDKLGNLYGTTTNGGTDGVGTVFKITSSGAESVLHSFPPNGADGDFPYAGLVLGKNNTLYGTTQAGGANTGGIVFKLVP